MYAIGAGWDEFVQAANLHWSARVTAWWRREGAPPARGGVARVGRGAARERPRSEEARGVAGEAILELDLGALEARR